MPHDATRKQSPQWFATASRRFLAIATACTVLGWGGWQAWHMGKQQWTNFLSPPLAMRGGDPHVRAMMRTISAAEAVGYDAYRKRFPSKTFDVSQGWEHPNICESVPWRRGYCSTAAGRYQLLWTTWQDWAARAGVDEQSFSPENQDRAVYSFLMAQNLQAMLHEGRAESAFCQLGEAAVWTSLPCGVEPNRHTETVLSLYNEFLVQEQQRVAVVEGRSQSS